MQRFAYKLFICKHNSRINILKHKWQNDDVTKIVYYNITLV